MESPLPRFLIGINRHLTAEEIIGGHGEILPDSHLPREILFGIGIPGHAVERKGYLFEGSG